MSAVILTFPVMDDRPNRIYELRRKAQLSQEELAKRAGMSKMNVSGLERGKRALSLDVMRRLARALDTYPADLLAVEDNPLRPDDAEREILLSYRNAEPEQQRNIERVTEALTSYRHQSKAA